MDVVRRTPPGVRELKHRWRKIWLKLMRRTPPGVRELKQDGSSHHGTTLQSHPSRGA